MAPHLIRHSLLSAFRERAFVGAIPRFADRFVEHQDDRQRQLWGGAQYGVTVYSTKNFGDEIQTIAQLGFLPRDRNLTAINRDHLSSYRGGPLRFIANGWYLHNVNKWPPAPNLEPVFVSFHMDPHWAPSSEGLAYLRRHAPIGCRDGATVERLRNLGIDAHFSGCLTLTLKNPYQGQERNGEVVICDANLGYDGGYPPSAKTLLERLVPREVRGRARVIAHECNSRLRHNHLVKTNLALAALETYARAKLVITTRLHCALPCRALGTPVVFLHQHYDSDPRFDGLRDVLRGYGPDTGAIELDWDNPQPLDIGAIRAHVRQAVEHAMERVAVA